MLHIIHGSDREKAKKKFLALIDGALKEDVARPYSRLQPESLSFVELEEQALAMVLFGSPGLVVGEGLFGKEETRQRLLETAPVLKESAQTFIFLEDKFPAEFAKKIATHAEVEFFQAQYLKPDERLAYAFLDAVGTRNRKNIWVSFEKARRSGLASEMLFWKLANQVKTLALVNSGVSQKELGINYDFVYNKALAAAKRFKREELVQMHSQLVRLFHDSHRESKDFGIALERWVLSV